MSDPSTTLRSDDLDGAHLRWHVYDAAAHHITFAPPDDGEDPTLWTVWIVAHIDGEVRNGGFEQLLDNHWARLRASGEVAEDFEGPTPHAAGWGEALRRIGADTAAALVDEMTTRLDRKPKTERAKFLAEGTFGRSPVPLRKTLKRGSREWLYLNPSVLEILGEWIHARLDSGPIATLIAAGEVSAPSILHNGSQLHAACRETNPSWVARRLAAGDDPNAQDDAGYSPLSHVLKDRLPGPSRLAVVDLLCTAGADVNDAGPLGRLPLVEAVDDLELTQRLLSAGADPNAKNNEGNAPLHVVTDPKIAKALLAAGADPNLRDPTGRTPLLCAVARDKHNHPPSKKLYRVLVKGGGDPNAVDAEGRDAGSFAYNADRGLYELADLGWVPTVIADEDGLHGETALHRAARNKNCLLSGWLLDQGYDPNPRLRRACLKSGCPAGSTPLDIAEACENRRVGPELRKRGAKHGERAGWTLVIDADAEERPFADAVSAANDALDGFQFPDGARVKSVRGPHFWPVRVVERLDESSARDLAERLIAAGLSVRLL